MIILLMGILAIGLVAGLIVTIALTKGKLRTYVIVFNIAILALWGVLNAINYNDCITEDEELADYNIIKGDFFAGIVYDGEIDGCVRIRYTGLSDEDPYVVPKDIVKVYGFSKIYKSVKIYTGRNKPILSGGEKAYRQLSDGTYAYYSDKILMLKPDLNDLVLFSGTFGGIILAIHNIVFGILAIVRKRKRVAG